MSNTLLALNVNANTEKKGGLTYLSWAWAWAEALKADPAAHYEVRMFGPLEARSPVCWIGQSAMVCVDVTLSGVARECWLPVMDHKNKAIQNPDAFAVNTAIQRCMTKALSLHGLGLYIYAGEDLPQVEAEEPAEERAAREKREKRGAELDELTLHLIDCHEAGKDLDAIRVWYAAGTWAADFAEKNEEVGYVWNNLKPHSKLRSAIKANRPEAVAA